jgi:hypothetical protein
LDLPNVFIQYTDSTSATENPIVACIEWQNCEVADICVCVVILDIDPSHRTDFVLAAADANDVELLFIPAGAIGKFQPLDPRTFEEFKARARQKFGR